MGNLESKEKVLELIKTLPVCTPNSIGTQWTVRCPYCGDSKDLSHGHLSIKIDMQTDSPMLWRCVRCEESGLVNDTLLKDLGLYVDSDLKQVLREESKKSSKYNQFLNSYIENLEIPKYNSDLARENLFYINQRLGSEFQLSDAQKYSMILDLDTFVRHNGMNSLPNMTDRMYYFLKENYVGFLTTNKNSIVFRLRTDAKNAKRYFKFKINPRNDNPSGFYSIHGAFDIMSTEPLHVHIAEGIFDILSIEHNLHRDQSKERHIYFASCGFGPMRVIQYLVYLGAGGNIVLHVYCDNDKSDWDEIKVLKRRREMIPWCSKILFHRNRMNGEKDYGVSLSRIEDSYKEMKVY